MPFYLLSFETHCSLSLFDQPYTIKEKAEIETETDVKIINLHIRFKLLCYNLLQGGTP